MSETVSGQEERQETLKSIEEMSAVELLQVPERERMHYISESWGLWLREQGYKNVAININLTDALTEQGAAQLAEGHAPPEAYQGRVDVMFWGVTSRMDRNDLTVYTLPTNNLEAEDDLTGYVKGVTGAPQFEVLKDMTEIMESEETFVLPFIPNEELHEAYGGRTLPPADRYNNKALMREMVAEVVGEEYAMPGFAMEYTDQIPADYIGELAQRIQNEAEKADAGKVWVKHAGTASGMSTIRVERGDTIEEIKGRLHGEIFAVPGDGEVAKFQPDSVVVEHHLEFGMEGGVGDFCLRGNITPEGQLVVQSAGRLICKDGEFQGMVSGSTEKAHSEQLEGLGLSYETFEKAVAACEGLTRQMYEEGYSGPISIDFFAGAEGSDEVLLRDINVRDGGASVAANVKNYSPHETRLDVEAQLAFDRQPTEEELNALYEEAVSEGILFYASSFMKYPTQEAGVVMCPAKLNIDLPEGVALTSDEAVNNCVRDTLKNIGNKLGVRLVSPV